MIGNASWGRTGGRRFSAMNARFRSVWMVIALLVFAGTASAQDRPDRRDVRLADDIVHQVNTYSRFTIFDDVNARIDQGVVTLSGKVTMPYKKNDIGKRIAGIDGVREVENKIDVLPVSQFDDQLRHRIARAIYGQSVVLELRRDGEPADPHHRGERPRHAHRRGEQQRRADAGAVAGDRASASSRSSRSFGLTRR